MTDSTADRTPFLIPDTTGEEWDSTLETTTAFRIKPGGLLRPMPRPQPISDETNIGRKKRMLLLPEEGPDFIFIDYPRAIELSMHFYNAQRSGDFEEPVDSLISWIRSSGLDDRGWDGTDLTGGWYNGL